MADYFNFDENKKTRQDGNVLIWYKIRTLPGLKGGVGSEWMLCGIVDRDDEGDGVVKSVPFWVVGVVEVVVPPLLELFG